MIYPIVMALIACSMLAFVVFEALHAPSATQDPLLGFIPHTEDHRSLSDEYRTSHMHADGPWGLSEATQINNVHGERS